MVKNDTPSKDAYYAIRTAIIEQKLKPGISLIENSLSISLGVGRSSVRTALQRLANEGFVEMFPNRGAFVAQFSEKQVRELYSLRQLFFDYALEHSIEAYTDNDTEFLKECLKKQEHAFQMMDFNEYVTAISQFYSLIMQKSGNEYLVELSTKVINRISVYLSLYDNFYSVKKLKSLPYHYKMIEGIQEGNLKKVIRAHDIICRRMLEAYDHVILLNKM